MYNGDFSKWVNAAGASIPIYDPATTRSDPTSRTGFVRDVFPGNVIPKDRFDPVALKALQRVSERWPDSYAQSVRYSGY